jgi:hypothetical protein
MSEVQGLLECKDTHPLDLTVGICLGA